VKIVEGIAIRFFAFINIEFLLFYGLFWLVLSYFIPIYKINRYTRITFILNNLIKILIVHFTFITTYISYTGGGVNSFKTIFVIYSLLFILMPLWRLLALSFLKSFRREGFNHANVIIIGQSKLSLELKDYFVNHPEHGFRFFGFYTSNGDGENVEGNIEKLKSQIKQQRVDEVYCALSELSTEEIRDLINFCRNNLVTIKFIPHAEGFNYHKITVDFYDLMPVLEIQQSPLDDTINKILKRTFDIVFSSFVIVVILSWLVPLIGLIIKITSPGPIFFKQKRSGLNNNSFSCLKFRSMRVNKDSDKAQAVKGDARVTKFGQFLRKSSLDEMPQFINVFIGNMSVVGPRPHMLKHTEIYSEKIETYLIRHYAKPGITGLSQVMGYRGETKELRLMRNRVKMDIFYIEHWSIWLDVKIVFLTVYNVLKSEENAY